jgi:hypothetical protein
VAERPGALHPAAITAGAAAQALAARLAEHGYRVMFRSRRGPAVFKLTGLPGDPDVEVTARDNGSAACHRTGSGLAEAAAVIARLPLSGYPGTRADASDTVTAAREGIEIEWHYLASPGQPADGEQVAAALLAHLSVLAAWTGRHEAALAAGARGTTRG